MDLQELKLSRDLSVPIYLQIYRRYRTAISAGKLLPGDRVPSVRSLASELGLARGTVEAAYQMLANEGYFLTRGAAGTVVSPRLEAVADPVQAKKPASVSRANDCPPPTARDILTFQLGVPALDAFPRKVWSRLSGRCMRATEIAAMTYPDPAGYEPLRRSIATYLGLSRGISCTHEQVFVTAGYRGALDLVCRTLLQADDVGWYEDPGYLIARQYLEHAGMRLAPIPVDEEGLNVEEGMRRAAHARFAVVTPTHQSPTGAPLSLPRRLALLEWARQSQAWVIEDDYDSEFRYAGRPLPALKSLDEGGRVLYTGSFSKVLVPGLRLGYLVVPTSLVTTINDALERVPGPGYLLPQAVVSEFMDQGHFGRHLRNMRNLYAERRGYLIDALLREAGDHLRIQPQAGGIHLLAQLNDRYDDKEIAVVAAREGLAVHALSNWTLGWPIQSGLLMGFANLATTQEAESAVRQLRGVLDRASSSP
ncbi:PLP-dependent aminotransferase family protein [Achromobacter spanius]|uniref:DNA-binding protein n=1 Tax=Achromobacter spanius TaxID=217203 RepID=A0A2S0IBA9_9BURK|nr:PLP-dependent aminotransferase family protein [Achromobacter spanius]AVJ29248.1 DNA-binding protein [Achromobacter spanius]